jgi:hypothetical protein
MENYMPPDSDLGGYGAASGYPGGSGGYDPYNTSGGGNRAAPPKPKSLRDKAIDSLQAGDSEKALQLLSAHLLTTARGGQDIGKYLQWAPALRRPALGTRLGIAVVYTTQPANYDGPPQPIGSAELEAALAEQQPAQQGREAGTNKRGNRRLGQRQRGNAGAGAGAAGASMPNEMAMGSDMYGGSGQQTASAAEDLEYFTGELGTKLVERLRKRLEAGDLGLIFKDALKAPPAPVPGGNPYGSGEEMYSDPAMMPGGPNMAAGGGGYPAPGGARGAAQDSNQIIPGVEFLGAVENMKELGELAKSSTADYLIAFEVTVRPATVTKYVKNVTKFRIVSAADVTKPLYMSPSLDNKVVYEARKKKSGDDPVDAALDAGLVLIDKMKMSPLPALQPEQALARIQRLIEAAPADAAPLLLEARLYLDQKLLKHEEMLNLTMTQVTEGQLAGLSELLDGADVKEKIAESLAAAAAIPDTPHEKFLAAVQGAAGLSNLLPSMEQVAAGMAAQGRGRGPGGAPSGYPSSGYPQAGYPQSSGPPSGYPQAQSGYPPGYPQPGASQPPGGFPQSGSGSSESSSDGTDGVNSGGGVVP